MTKTHIPIIIATLTALALGGLAALPGGSVDSPYAENYSSGDHTLHLIAYAVPKPGFDAITKSYHNTTDGAEVSFKESFGASGDQSRKVARHVPADLVNFSVEPDITRLVKAGLVDKEWKNSVPQDPSGRSVPFGSVLSLVVRKNNPKNIHDWDDLLQPGIDIITPNPASSGSAKWNLLAPYTAWLSRAIGSEEDPENLLAAHHSAMKNIQSLIADHVSVRPKSGREASSTFVQGQGDVLLTYENEALMLTQDPNSPYEIITPSETFRIENPVAVINTSDNLEQAYKFRNYLFTPPAQKIWKEQGFRPAEELFSEQLHSIDSLSALLGTLAQHNPDIASSYDLISNHTPRQGWDIVDKFLFARSQAGTNTPDGFITTAYKEASHE